MGRTFAAALQEGLGRVSPPWATTSSGGTLRRGLPQAPSAVLLRDHREEILTRLAAALPTAMRAAGHVDGDHVIPALLAWSRARMLAATAAGLSRPDPRDVVPLPFPLLKLTVATLLLESAAGVLPDLPARDLALRALGHAVRE
ncbi:hypothetical protein [uncultured Streptomyces sp.]|uniref:hypothetical protein n=1 Tax=uncultured Streptomyces sp. TaxID=174707 RepID=UPI0026255973|nr:hypothetical protein [uncultured Streptomyces sp.]